MNSFITTEQLAARLQTSGYVPGAQATRSSLTFVRDSSVEGLWEWVLVESAGRSFEALSVTVTTSVTRFIPFLRLMKLRHLTELATDLSRGTALISTEVDAHRWMDSLAVTVPSVSTVWAAQHGVSLLEDTGPARKAVEAYLGFIPCTEDRLESGDAEVEGLVTWPGVLHLFDSAPLYRRACQTLISHQAEVDPQVGVPYARQNPLSNQDFMWRIQLLVDRLLLRQQAVPGRILFASVAKIQV